MIEEPGHQPDEQAYRIAYLIAGYIRKTLTEAEHDELDAWVEASDANMRLFEELTDERDVEANLEWMDRLRVERKLMEAKKHLRFMQPLKSAQNLWVWTAAACLLVALGMFVVNRMKGRGLPETADFSPPLKNDVPPGGPRASLTLNDGSVIDLSKAANGLLKTEAGLEVKKITDGELAYSANLPSASLPTRYNTLTTPKGGQYKVLLPDGSRVWLNAESYLKYPTSFTGTERSVEMKGEGYFEVARNAGQPFRVLLNNGSNIKVLGTHFNVRAYSHDAAVTLLEGSVELHKESKVQRLQPGEQGILSTPIKIIQEADTESVVGWKQGQFVFHDAPIRDIMEEVGRWFDVEVIYQAPTSQHFNAIIPRDEPVSKLLHYLEETGQIHFKIDNRKIYVLP